MKYRNSVNAGQFIMPNGLVLMFKDFTYETEDTAEIEQLDACAKTPGTTISHFDALAHITGPAVDVKPEKLAEAAANILKANANKDDPKLQALLERAKQTAHLPPALGAVSSVDVKDAAKG